MNEKSRFSIIYASQARKHIKPTEQKYHSLIRQTIEDQLIHDPDVETKNRKPLKRPVEMEGEWEIWFGPDNRFGMFYEVDRENRQIRVLAVGVKKGNRLFLGKEEITL